MKTNRWAASLKPSLQEGIQLTTLSGMWSRKIAQLATPRKRSSRRSRPFGGRMALIFMDDARKKATGWREIVTRLRKDYTDLQIRPSSRGITAHTITGQPSPCP